MLYVLEDASYWCYLEYGTMYIPVDPFIAPDLLRVEQLIRDAFSDFIRSAFDGTQHIRLGDGGCRYQQMAPRHAA